MAINEHPAIGTILTCDFNKGFIEPEMVKRRPVIVISPKISVRYKLCTVVALSTKPPTIAMPYHCKLAFDPPLPEPYTGENWVKGDMVYAVSFDRLDLIRTGKDQSGKRTYRYETISPDQLKQVRKCVLSALGLASLTVHL